MLGNEKAFSSLSVKSGGLALSVMIIIYMVFTVLIQAVFLALSVTGGIVYTAVNALAAPLAIAATVFLTKANTNQKLSFTLNLNKSGVKYYLIAIIFAAGMFLGFGFVNGLISSGLEKAGITQSSISLDFNGVGSLIVYIISFAVIPAVAEELFFRGLIQNSLSGLKIWQAVLISSISFALYHCSLVQLVYQLIYGAALFVLAYSAKSVFPGILAHFLNNFAVIIFTYFGLSIDFYNILVIISGLILFAAAGVWTAESLRKNREQKEFNQNPLDFLLAGLFGVAICLSLIVANLFLGA